MRSLPDTSFKSNALSTWQHAPNFLYICYHIYLLGKGGYVFGGVGLSVCLFVCLFVDNITQEVMNGLG